jgi:hypothetical protein
MRLGPGKWRILIEGDELVAPQWRHGFDYLVLRLFSGEEVAPSALEHYHVKVRPLADSDEIITVPPEAL